MSSTGVRLDRVVFGKSLGAQQATVDGVVRIAAYADGLSVFDSTQHSAADRAVTTGRRHPAVGNFPRRRKAHHPVVGVGVFFGENVEPELAPDRQAAAF